MQQARVSGLKCLFGLWAGISSNNAVLLDQGNKGGCIVSLNSTVVCLFMFWAQNRLAE